MLLSIYPHIDVQMCVSLNLEFCARADKVLCAKGIVQAALKLGIECPVRTGVGR